MAGTYLLRTPSSASNRKTWTWSAWVKRSELSASNQVLFQALDGSFPEKLQFNSAAKLEYDHDIAGTDYTVRSDMVFRDTSNWYHIMVAKDTTQATETNRIKVYVNGEQQTLSEYQLGYPPQNYNGAINNNVAHHVGANNTSEYFNGLMSHVHFCDGAALAPTVFGSTDSTTGEWKINTSPSVTYGTNGFFILKDSGSKTDQSGNSNNFSEEGTPGIVSNTQDSPSNVFATWNSLANQGSVTLNYGNTRAVFTASGWNFVYSTLGASSGKYYYEVKAANTGSDSNIGIMEMDTATNEQGTADNVGKNTESVSYASNGSIKKNNVTVQTGLGSISTGDILGIAMDLDNNTVQFYLQGVAKGTAVSIASDKTYAFATSGYTNAEHQTNFGNGYFGTTAVSSAGTNASGIGIFEYDVPTGFTALSTKGLNL